MSRQPIEPDRFHCQPFHLWAERWFLLGAGTCEPPAFNVMTVAWGFFGVLWAKPAAIVAVRPSRHTYSFMEKYPDFTLCAFPASFQPQLSFCGAKSGRDVDKIKHCGLTPIASAKVGSPGFEEADLIVECRKIHFEDLNPEHFLDERIEDHYSGSNYHRFYTGEIVAVSGTAAYRR